MTSTRRLLIIVGIVVIAGLGFIFAKASNNNNEDFPADTTAELGTVTGPGDGGAGGTATGGEGAARSGRGGGAAGGAAIPTIVVRGLRPVGGIKKMTFQAGGTIRFKVTSDQPEEVHFHGYDVAKDVGPGRPVTFAVPAKIEGIFEAELEHTGTQIASITVEP